MGPTKETFFALLRAGLWPDVGSTDLRNLGSADWNKVYQLAEEQSVAGLVVAGFEYLKGINAPQEVVLQFVGTALQIEQKNLALNEFAARLIDKLRKEDVRGLLVKGQGVAQCYEKPLWRTSGDIDLLLDDENYEKAKAQLIPLADEVHEEDRVKKHQGLVIKDFDIELHGRMPFELSKRVDSVIDDVIQDSLKEGGVRTWKVNDVAIYLPKPDNDVIIIFTHFLHHFFIEGVGLRQICDWCRLLWRYRSELDLRLLESRIFGMGLMSEWKAFGALAVEYLGMPREAMPFYDSRYRRRGERVLKKILECGNFGHNHDLSYRTKFSGVKYKIVALWRRLKDFAEFTMIFPIDAPKFFVHYVFRKI